jgi:hypothetical protein
MRFETPLRQGAPGAWLLATLTTLPLLAGAFAGHAQDAEVAPGSIAAIPEAPYACRQPPVDVPRSQGCSEGEPYPACRWQIPRDDDLLAIWRNTTPNHRWGRPGLVSLVLAAAAEVRQRWPGRRLVVGDLDAPGPRHQTHERGVDVDLYLPESMVARNAGGGRYPSNYRGRPAREVAGLRAEVLDLARILASCAEGQVRIYYNDRIVQEAFLAWFGAAGLRSAGGAPMEPHNRLHRFHFHLTVPEDLEPLPLATP